MKHSRDFLHPGEKKPAIRSAPPLRFLSRDSRASPLPNLFRFRAISDWRVRIIERKSYLVVRIGPRCSRGYGRKGRCLGRGVVIGERILLPLSIFWMNERHLHGKKVSFDIRPRETRILVGNSLAREALQPRRTR